MYCPRSFHTKLIQQPTDPLRPIIQYNAYATSITAAAGTRLTSTSFLIDVIIFLTETVLQKPFITDASSPV